MKKLPVLFLSLLAVCVFSAVATASAFAESEWLDNGNPIAAGTKPAVDIEGELTLEDSNVPFVGKTKVNCSGILDGTVGPGGVDEITEVLNLALELIGKELVGLTLLCTPLVGCEAGMEAEVWPDHLPWLTQVELMTGTGEPLFLDHLFKDSSDSNTEQPGWHVVCLVLGGITGEDLCTGLSSVALENMMEGGLLAIFNPAAPVLSEPGLCTASGTESGVVEGSGTILFTETGLGPITVS